MNQNTAQVLALALIMIWVLMVIGTPDLIDALVARIGDIPIEQVMEACDET